MSTGTSTGIKAGTADMTTTEQERPAPALELVVARYREDLSWLRELGLPSTVYNKGPELSPELLPPETRLLVLPNLGREAHTFLTHIIRRYDALPEFTAFLQGDPFAHLAPPDGPRASPQALRLRLLEMAAQNQPFAGLAWFRLRCDGLGRPHDLADPAKEGRWKGWGKNIPVARVFEELFGSPAPQEFIARAPTGNMLVRRDRILARSRGFYQRALDLVLADADDAENTGHALERLWQTVFSGAARGASSGRAHCASPSQGGG
ncbi:MAG: DUF3431 domain-containing protein [Humidesulfovibrio sp.]|uniref:DUF3431 domain-containing protein n=1 Tax=Humidesulfovibrio sp. TaxID=2910988 RepID=UPI00273760B2|nr:DUF3431 domain-containing protein [Humidesulfovibrio sp.]MDP2848244.1 DUF3431 domain-containing protein [Humidesulfovibrio sp.]